MSGDKELLNYLSENIDMGIEALEVLIKNLEKTDNKIKSNVLKSMEEYRKFQKKCNKLRKEMKSEPAKSNFWASFMTRMGTNMEFKRDNSDSKMTYTDLLMRIEAGEVTEMEIESDGKKALVTLKGVNAIG